MRLVPDESAANVVKEDHIEAINAFLVGIDGDEEELEDLEDATRVTSEGIEWAMGAEVIEGIEPRNVDDARKRADWPKWEAAILDELGRMEKLGMWDLVERPTAANVVGSKWVFKIKRGAAGEITKYKARLVAQGFTQVPGIDYGDMFAPVAKLTSIRVLLALAARFDWEIHQMDVKNAFLNGDLEEEIYMKQPPGYAAPGLEDKVCRLIKTIYGLKQSSQRWYKKLCDAFFEMGFKVCSVEHGIFTKHDETKGTISIIAASVDDFALLANSLVAIDEMKDALNHAFEMTDLGEIHWLLGIEIKRDRGARTISLSQRAYIDTILSRFNLENANPLSTATDPNSRLSISQCPSMPHQFEEMRNVPYQEAIGSVMYAALAARPDICFAVTYLSQFMQNPRRPHWEAAKRLFRYLKGTRELWLVLGVEQCSIEGFSDADHARQEHRHSISGYVFLFDGGAVSWSSKKQPIIAQSSTEAEYVAMAHATKEALWMRMFLGDILSPLSAPIIVYGNNLSAISLAKNDTFHTRTKHIDVRYHFICDIVNKNLIELCYCPTGDMAADGFMKPLTRQKIDRMLELIGLQEI
ncbi:hypothetical protein EW146_g10151 [Bondarzewia mesenterica]|uniref:Reverse transcriptase Ty1/copia-type domain-containing protein n=1 Tax=Bondarzewia mesenterica TaxID=1095465 RepID=A0A4S4L1T1_9AGAM|nr:hypothetical protein EW146_g10151 [Bondarzewia mesenterica]